MKPTLHINLQITSCIKPLQTMFTLSNVNLTTHTIINYGTIMKYIFLIIAILCFSENSYADYDNNFTGKVISVLTYPYSKQILIRVEGQPTAHPICNNFDYMAIEANIDNEARQLVFSRLLMAYASGEIINIGYDSKDECVGSRIKIYRVG